MAEVKTSIVVDLSGNIQQRGRQYINTLSNIGSQGARSFQLMRQSAGIAGRGLDALGNRYTALITGAAGVGAAKMVMDHQRRLTRLGVSANRSAEEIHALNEEIFSTAQAPDIRLDPGEITSAIEEIMEKTGDLRFAEQNIRNIGLAIQATGASGKDIGGIMAEFQKMGITDFKTVLESLDILNVQGKEGAFTLQNLAALGPRVITAYTSMGRGGIQALRELGAVLQVIRQGTGGPEQAATAFEALMRTLSDGSKIKMLQKGGIQVFDPEALKQGKEVLRPINELMVEIVKRTKGKKTLLSEIFDAEAMRAFNSIIDEYKRTGDITSLDKFMRMQADGTVLTKNSAQVAKDATGAMENLYTAWKKFADANLLGPIKALADTINKLNPETVQAGMQGAKYGLYILGGMMLGRKAFGAVKAIPDLWKTGKGASGALGGLAGGMGGPVPVYVVNKNLSMLPGKDGFGLNPSNPSSYGKSVLQKTTGSVAFLGLSPLIAPTIAALAAETSMAIGKAISERQAATSSPSALRELMGRHMVMGGGADSYQVKTIGSALNKGFSGEMRSDVNLNIKIDDDRVSVKKMSSSNRNVMPNVDAGLTMRSH